MCSVSTMQINVKSAWKFMLLTFVPYNRISQVTPSLSLYLFLSLVLELTEMFTVFSDISRCEKASFFLFSRLQSFLRSRKKMRKLFGPEKNPVSLNHNNAYGVLRTKKGGE